MVDKHCDLEEAVVVGDYRCFLTQIDEKSDKFYVLQLLTNSKDHFVWTRWGRNGTSGQNKLEGPMKLSDAEKSFKKKFQDKTKNKWEEKDNFVSVRGKYTLVIQADQSTTDDVQQTASDNLAGLEAEKPSFPETVVSGVTLHSDLLYQIMFFLSTRDVMRCMQVCKFWKMVLSEKYFWKMFAYNRFDLRIMSNVKYEGPFGMWSDPNEWFCYYENEDDRYVIRPFPLMWRCKVIHPFDLDITSGDVKSLQGFCRSLEILIHMNKMVDTFGIASGNECSGSEGQDSICVVLFPWSQDQLPIARTILSEIFHFHPEILEEYLDDSDQGEIREEKLYYHLPALNGDGYEQEHDIEENPCLNRIFGFGAYEPGQGEKSVQKAEQFYAWLQNIMVPSITVYAGGDKLNPVAVFFVTKLAPGWVGGALTGCTFT